MSLEERLEEQRRRVEALRRQLGRDTVRPEDLRQADEAHSERVAEVEARLERLAAGRQACLDKYDTEIAAQRALLHDLQGGTGRPPGGGQPARDEDGNGNGNGDRFVGGGGERDRLRLRDAPRPPGEVRRGGRPR